MVIVRRRLVILIGAVALAGCAEGPVKEISRIFERKGEPQLQAGIKNYDEGRLSQAQGNFESALAAGLNQRDQVTAHKYLAFIHCVSKRERQCRAHFRSALELDPNFDLQPAEAGHPMWGPVFRSVKKTR
jgi:Tfp pilus assembly protein PilF